MVNLGFVLECKNELDNERGSLEELEKGLQARVIIQEKESHWVERSQVEFSSPYGTLESCWNEEIIDKPEISEPDIKKREKTKAQLQQIYDSGNYYTTRYDAGNLLGKRNRELKEGMRAWLIKLEKGLFAVKSENGRESPDEEKRIRAAVDAWRLYEKSFFPPVRKLLKRAYSLDETVSGSLNSWEARKTLQGYSLRTIFYEHPVITFSSVTAGVIGGAIGLAYLARELLFMYLR